MGWVRISTPTSQETIKYLINAGYDDCSFAYYLHDVTLESSL
jgi:hypothetical protein